MSIEQSFFNSFTRGGQFFNHFVRMAKDNLVRYFALAFLVTAVFGYLKWNKITDDHDKYVLWNEGTYRVILKVKPDLDKEVRLFHADGGETIVQMNERMLIPTYAADVERSMSLFWGAVRYGFIFGFTIFIIVMIAAGLIGRALGTDKHQRGARLTDAKKVKKIITSWNKVEAKKTGLIDYVPYELVGVPYPLRAETQHTMFVGSTGSGKTQGIAKVIAQIKARGDRAVVYDKMRSFPELFYNPEHDIILNPLDSRCPAWDIFADARHIVDWENMAQAFIPESDGDPIWHTTARSVFAHTANRMVKAAKKGGKRPTIKALIYLLLKSSDQELSDFLGGSPAGIHINPENSRTTGSIRTTLADAIRSIGYIRDPRPGEKAFSIREWIKDDDREGIVFLSSRDDIHTVLQPLITMWIAVFTSALMSQERSSSRLIWFILDELPTLNRLPGLERSLAEARQYGACYLIGLQLISQLRDLYGNDKADSIVGLTRNKLVFNPGDPITAEVMSKFIGSKEILRREHGISIGAESLRDGQSVNSRVTTEAIILPEELSQLPGLHGILSMTGDFPACKVVLDYTSLSGDQAGYIEDEDAIDRADAIFELEEPQPQKALPESEAFTVNDDEEPSNSEEGPTEVCETDVQTDVEPIPTETTSKPAFQLLTDEELDALSDEQLTAYFKAKKRSEGGADNSRAKPKTEDHIQHTRHADKFDKTKKMELAAAMDVAKDRSIEKKQNRELSDDVDDDTIRAQDLLRPRRTTPQKGHGDLPLHFGGR